MKFRFKEVLLAALVLLSFAVCASAAEGFVPTWKVGDYWVLEASYRDMRSPGEVWMPPLLWIFKVRSIRDYQGQSCYVVHVFPRHTALKVQAVLYLTVEELKPLRVIDIYPTNEGIKSFDRDLDPDNPQPLLAEDTLAPYDLPVFPLVRPSIAVQGADGFAAYRSEPIARTFAKIKKVGGLSFKRIVAQKNKAPDRQYADTFAAYRSAGDSFQVELAEPRSNTSLIQLWQDGQPWAISSESVARKIRLVPQTQNNATPENGGNE